MGRLIVANRRGDQVLEWPDTDTEEARQQIALAERIFRRPAPMERWSRRRSTASTCWTGPPSIPRSRSIRLWRPLPGASRLATALAAVGAWWHRCWGRPAEMEPGVLPLERPGRRT